MTTSATWMPPRSAISRNFNGLIDQLIQKYQLIDLNESGFEAFLDSSGNSVVLLTEEPDKVPESWDLAVIFPSLLMKNPIQPLAAISRPDHARSLLIRFGVQRMPALLFLRDGAYVGVIEGLRDWNELVGEYDAMLLKPVSRARSIGVAVTATTTKTCNN
jgi:hydrogenase-1 operon protein HyaE